MLLPFIPTITDSPSHPVFGRAFDPIQQWNLLSVSKSNEYTPSFNKLVILDTSNPENTTGKPLPVILTKDQDNQCKAYKPSSATIIKFNQQNNALTKLTSLPEGVECE